MFYRCLSNHHYYVLPEEDFDEILRLLYRDSEYIGCPNATVYDDRTYLRLKGVLVEIHGDYEVVMENLFFCGLYRGAEIGVIEWEDLPTWDPITDEITYPPLTF